MIFTQITKTEKRHSATKIVRGKAMGEKEKYVHKSDTEAAVVVTKIQT